MALENLEPKRVWYYFEELTKIPRESGNCAGTAAYIIDFAKKHGFDYETDEIGNVIVRKPASKGYENAPGVILQGHMDMVCVHSDERVIDFAADPIIPMTDGENVWADGTSLGADDGIGVAYGLALLEDETALHPALECLFTVDEEIGLYGANALDANMLHGDRLINLDSEEEGYLTVSCAGGLRSLGSLEATRCILTGLSYEVKISGLKGGHSGVEINKHRTNAIKLLGRVLAHMSSLFDIRIEDLKGGSRENVIASSAQAKILMVNKEKAEALEKDFETFADRIKKELAVTEPGVNVTLTPVESELLPFTVDCTKKVIFLLYHTPFGIQSMDPSLEGMVQTSINCGLLSVEDEKVLIKNSIRSSVSSEKLELKERLTSLFEFLGGSVEFMAEYPAWEYRTDSPLRDLAIEAYKNVTGKEIKVVGIHAGLECGIFTGKKPSLDCISFGPDLFDVHSVKEHTNTGTVSRSYEYLKELLKLLR